MALSDTIVAVASVTGGTRGVVRVSGAGTVDVLRAVLVGWTGKAGRGCFAARLKLGGGEEGGELPVLVLVYQGPRSYTGEDAAELVTVGNPLVLERVAASMCAVEGVRGANPGEFTARAFLAGKLSLERAEGVAAVIVAESAEELEAGRALMAGRSGERYRVWGEELAMLLALVEAGIDFTDQEDVVPIAPVELRRRVGALMREIEGFLGAARGAEVVSGLPRVVLVGRPNAGKSTLFNALLGRRRAVVADEAGTTRDVLEERLELGGDLAGGGAVILVDMAGLDTGAAEDEGMKRWGGVEREAQRRARQALGEADVVVECDPAGRFAGLGEGNVQRVRVRTKADRPWGSGGALATDCIEVCALDGWNVAVLRRALAEAAFGAAGAGRGRAGTAVPRHRRALAAAVRGLDQAQLALGRDKGRIADPEMVAAGLREALDALGELIGRISPDDVIGRIFASFCVGK